MTRGKTGHGFIVAAASAALLWLLSGGAWAQTPTPGAGTDCADFATQEQAQAFYDQHKDDQAGNPDPFDLDTDKDGKACEGLPASTQATASPVPGATATPSANSLPQNGAETGIIAL